MDLGSLELCPTRAEEKEAGKEGQHEKQPGWDPTCTRLMFSSLLLTPTLNPLRKVTLPLPAEYSQLSTLRGGFCSLGHFSGF